MCGREARCAWEQDVTRVLPAGSHSCVITSAVTRQCAKTSLECKSERQHGMAPHSVLRLLPVVPRMLCVSAGGSAGQRCAI